MNEFRVEGADLLGGDGDMENKGRPPAKIESDIGDGILHRNGGPAIAKNAGLIAKSLVEGRSKHEGDVLNSVMVVDVGVSFGGDGKVDKGMLGKVGKHVVKESDTG